MPQIFNRGANFIPLAIVLVAGALGTAAFAAFTYYWTPKYTRVGYEPQQPIPFSHRLHSGQLGIDCRYCHTHVETAAHSNIPSSQVCMSCHQMVQKDNPKLAPLREAWETGKPVPWVQIHKTPDYAYFNHAVHVNRGISCVSCHGRVDQMEVVSHAEPQSMGWCLDCHRNPEQHLRPVDKVTDLGWTPPTQAKALADLLGTTPDKLKLKADAKLSPKAAQLAMGEFLNEKRGIHAPDSNCAACHR